MAQERVHRESVKVGLFHVEKWKAVLVHESLEDWGKRVILRATWSFVEEGLLGCIKTAFCDYKEAVSMALILEPICGKYCMWANFSQVKLEPFLAARSFLRGTKKFLSAFRECCFDWPKTIARKVFDISGHLKQPRYLQSLPCWKMFFSKKEDSKRPGNCLVSLSARRMCESF